jgi:pyrroline-5-carboxylate reductase
MALQGKKIGFIGAGMMAEAIARGLLRVGVSPDAVSASDPDGSRHIVFGEMGIRCVTDNRSVAGSADILILAVKPFLMQNVLAGLSGALSGEQLVISIAAGVTTSSIESALEAVVPVVRVMPNTPCLLGEGASGIAPGKHATPEQLALASEVLSSCGKVVQVTEDKLDAVTGLSGSGPAYVYMFIEALTAGGLRMGIPRDAALTLAAQTVLGAAKMVIETGEHPAVLRDKVTTPAGTTIEGIATLEGAGLRSAVIEAVTAATNRSTEIGKSSKS